MNAAWIDYKQQNLAAELQASTNIQSHNNTSKSQNPCKEGQDSRNAEIV